MISVDKLVNNSLFYELISAFNQVAGEWEGIDGRGDQQEATLEKLKSYFRNPDTADPREAYQQSWQSFTRRYWISNLLKNYIAINELKRIGVAQDFRNILDLGSGPGAFAFAYLLSNSTSKSEPDSQTNLYMVDAVKEFHEIFHKIWNGITEKHRRGINIRQCEAFIDSGIVKFHESPDLIIMSNSIVEILRNQAINREKFLSSLLQTKAVIIIIDYEYYEHQILLNDLGNYFNNNNYKNLQIGHWQSRHELFQIINPRREQFTIKEHLPGNYYLDLEHILSICIPHTESTTQTCVDRLVRQYKKAWENHDLKILKDIFTKDATYIEKPDQVKFQGLEQIMDYWRLNAATQSQVEFTPLHMMQYGNKINVKWECRFYRKDKSRWFNLEGTFDALLQEGKILHFSERFINKSL